MSIMMLICTSTCLADPVQTSKSVRLERSSFYVEIIVQPDFLLKEFGPRFDLTATVKQVTLDGKTFLCHSGLSDEFGLHGFGLRGFDQANMQTPFIKIGVGTLLRDDMRRYYFSHRYPIKQLAPVTIEEKTSTSITISQKVDDPEYGYDYRKTYRIADDSPTLTITYTLINTGKSTLLIEQYNHNWFNFANTAIDDAYRLQTGFDINCRPWPWYVQDGRHLALKQPITRGHYVSSSSSSTPANNWLKLSHSLTGKSVNVSGDFPVGLLGFYVQQDAICPEVHMTQILAGYQQWTWSRTYQFHTP